MVGGQSITGVKIGVFLTEESEKNIESILAHNGTTMIGKN